MRRVLFACIASLALYAGLFGGLIGRPLAYGFLERQIDAKLARGRALTGPKLVILAGSNAPYSHRCEVVEPMLAMPCVNAGVAVGIGLDYLFARWEPLLHTGDVVYMPMEQEQYVRSRSATRLGPDAAIMLRDDRATLARLPPDRWLGALFAFDLRGALMAGVETALVDGHVSITAAGMQGWNNDWGDHVGHTAALAMAYRTELAAMQPWLATAADIRDGYGTALIAGFVRRATVRGVRVIGGLPTGFADAPIPAATVGAMRAVYLGNGGSFLVLANASRYPRADFFDSDAHLDEPCQIAQSVMLARALAPLLGRAAHPPPRLAAAASGCAGSARAGGGAHR